MDSFVVGAFIRLERSGKVLSIIRMCTCALWLSLVIHFFKVELRFCNSPSDIIRYANNIITFEVIKPNYAKKTTRRYNVSPCAALVVLLLLMSTGEEDGKKCIIR